jgi:hypothetical protein
LKRVHFSKKKSNKQKAKKIICTAKNENCLKPFEGHKSDQLINKIINKNKNPKKLYELQNTKKWKLFQRPNKTKMQKKIYY